MPRLLPAEEIPLIKEETAFCRLDEERLSALVEAEEAPNSEEEFVAVSIAVHLWEAQQTRLESVTSYLKQAAASGYDVNPARVWLEAWMEVMSAGLVNLAERNNELVQIIGTSEAEQIGLKRAKPRIDALVEEIQRAQLSEEPGTG